MKVYFALCGQDKAEPIEWPQGWPLPHRNDTVYIFSEDGARYMTVDYVDFDPSYDQSVTIHEKA